MRIALDTGVLIASVKRRGERYHKACLELSRLFRSADHEALASALVLIELPGGLASSTSMPFETIYQTGISVQKSFNLQILSFEDYVDRTVELMIEFRDLKRKLGIESADFHHLATSIREGCEFFVTIDEHHLLVNETVEALSKYTHIVNPHEAVKKLSKLKLA